MNDMIVVVLMAVCVSQAVVVAVLASVAWRMGESIMRANEGLVDTIVAGKPKQVERMAIKKGRSATPGNNGTTPSYVPDEPPEPDFAMGRSGENHIA